MDFPTSYAKFKNVKLDCDITKSYKINFLTTGSNPTNNIIAFVSDSNKNLFVIKIMVDSININTKIKPDYNKLEAKFYQFFTKKYIFTLRTPHIVGLYNHQTCKDVEKLMKKINPKSVTCPTHTDILTKINKLQPAQTKICDIITRRKMDIIDSDYDILLLEYCIDSLDNMMNWYMIQMSHLTKTRLTIHIAGFINNLERILFQLIFTLAIIKQEYPGFKHGDFFVRNILLSTDWSHDENDYVAYHYIKKDDNKQKVFYLKANGMYSKINDFGMAIIANDMLSNIYPESKKLNKYYNNNPFNEKNDIFNLLNDIYDGQNIGSDSIRYAAFKLKLSDNLINPIKKFISKFLKTRTIDQINKNNHYLLNTMWNIDTIKILEDTVKTPEEYLLGTVFSEYKTLPKNGNVIMHYNQSV